MRLLAGTFCLFALLLLTEGRIWKGHFAVTSPMYYNAHHGFYGGDKISEEVAPEGKYIG